MHVGCGRNFASSIQDRADSLIGESRPDFWRTDNATSPLAASMAVAPTQRHPCEKKERAFIFLLHSRARKEKSPVLITLDT